MPQDDLPERERLQRWRWDVGDRIRAIRKTRRVTQEQLAHTLGVDRTTVVRWEQGQHPMSIDQVARIAWALDVPLWRLFRDDDVAGADSADP